jgi:protoheme ferro-lyase
MMKLPMKMLVAVPLCPHSSISSSASAVPEIAAPIASASSGAPRNITAS